MSEPYYQFKLVPAAGADLSDRLNELGREGFHIAGVDGGCVYLQRLVQEDDAPVEVAGGGDVPGDEETVDPLCGCGCGDSVIVGISAWKMAMDAGKVWFLAGHGEEAGQHAGPYTAAPRRARTEA